MNPRRRVPEHTYLVSSNTFAALGLAESLLRALDQARFVQPTPIQETAIPHLLAGRDLLGVAQTGTGKTAAFALPMLQHLAGTPKQPHRYSTRALILAPTRELALQIEESLNRLGSGQKCRVVAILGGVSRFMQVQRMRAGTDIVVGTPGRVCDLMATGELKLNEVTHFVLDEADRMLDLGFIRDIRRIVAALPVARQSALFSATMPAEVAKLAETLLRDPVRVDVARTAAVELPIEQHVHFVEPAGKRALLDRLLTDPALSRVIVFTRTKHTANRVAKSLDTGGVRVSALHGNKSQPARQKALEQFRSGRARVPGRDRHRRARHRCDRHFACHQLRPAGATGGLRAPHRPDRTGRCERRRNFLLRCRGTWYVARYRAHDRRRDQRCRWDADSRSDHAWTAAATGQTCAAAPLALAWQG